MTTITLAEATAIVGTPPAKWVAGNGTVRHYFNVQGAAYKLWWAGDKLHFSMGKGRSTTEANDTAKRVIGCNPTDRYSRTSGPAAYIIVEG